MTHQPGVYVPLRALFLVFYVYSLDLVCCQTIKTLNNIGANHAAYLLNQAYFLI